MKKKENEQEVDVVYEGDPFTMVPNAFITDSTIHPYTRFLYCLIKYYTGIPKFTLYRKTLKKQLNLKTDEAFDKFWRELKKLGYLEQIKNRKEDGTYKYSYILHSIRDRETTPPSNQGVDTPKDGKPGVFNNNNFNKNNINNNKDLDLKDNEFYNYFEKQSNDIDIHESNPESFYLIKLTEQQEKDVNRLIIDIGTHKLNSTKEDLFKYIIRLYKNNFKDHNGKSIKSLYATVSSAFKNKTKKDEQDKEWLKKKAEDGDPYAAEALDNIYY